MRSVYGLGAVRAMVDRGLHEQVRSIHCVSSGVIPALALSMAGSGAGIEAMLEPLVDRIRHGDVVKWWRAGRVFDLDQLVDIIADVTFGPGRSAFSPERGPSAQRIPVEVALTDVETGGARYVDLTKLDFSDWKAAMKATMALPLLYSPPVYLDGIRYIDGGIADPLPLQRAISTKADRVVAITSKELERAGEPSSRAARTVMRLMPHVTPAVKRRVRHRNPLGADCERLLTLGRFGDTELTPIVPSRRDVLVPRAERRWPPLSRLEQLGYDDAMVALAAGVSG